MRRAKPLPPVELLTELLDYDPATGVFRWKSDRARLAKAGGISGSVDPTSGYHRICVGGRHLKAHRIAYLLVHGVEPDEVDHINGVRTDNRVSNLRAADSLTNAKNASHRADSACPVTGVTWNKSLRKWKVRTNHKGRTIYLGVFESLLDAISVRSMSEQLLGYSARHGW